MTGAAIQADAFGPATVVESMDKRVSSLFRYDPDGTCTRMMDKLICSNGLAFSGDGRRMYHSDSRQDYVWEWDFDKASGAISNQRVFLRVDIQEGRPDGAAIDAEGYYWIAHIGAWRIARYSPDGIIDRVVGLPVQRPTMCAFGGKDLKTLYVTRRDLPARGTGSSQAAARRGNFCHAGRSPGNSRAVFRGIASCL